MGTKFLEKDLEDIIFESDKNELRKRGLHIYGKIYRQVRIGNYGIADLIEVKRIPSEIVNGRMGEFASHLDITIYELKKDKIDFNAFMQAVKYAKGISRYFKKHRHNIRVQFRIVLIGSEISMNDDFTYITDMFTPDISSAFYSPAINFVTFYKYKYNFDGIYFNVSNQYALIEEGF